MTKIKKTVMDTMQHKLKVTPCSPTQIYQQHVLKANLKPIVWFVK